MSAGSEKGRIVSVLSSTGLPAAGMLDPGIK